jgi:hypothetical protein
MPMFFFDLTDDGASSSPDKIGTDFLDRYLKRRRRCSRMWRGTVCRTGCIATFQ